MTPADQIIDTLEALALRMYPDDELGRALFLSDKLSEKIREITYVPGNGDRIVAEIVERTVRP